MSKVLPRLLLVAFVFCVVSIGAAATSTPKAGAPRGDEMKTPVSTVSAVANEAEDEEEFDDRLEHLLESMTVQ